MTGIENDTVVISHTTTLLPTILPDKKDFIDNSIEYSFTVHYNSLEGYIEYDLDNSRNYAVNETPYSMNVDVYDQSSMNQFMEIVKYRHHSFAEYKNDKKSRENFISADAICFDLDDITPECFTWNDVSDEINYIIYSSRSGSSHLVIPLEEPIDDYNTFKTYTSNIGEYLETKDIVNDKGFSLSNFNPARKSGEICCYEGFEFYYNCCNTFIDQICLVEDFGIAKSENPDKEYSYSRFQNTFELLDNEYRFKCFATFANWIRDIITAADWFKIGNVFHTEMGDVNGRELFHLLSDDYKGKTYQEAEKNYDQIQRTKTCDYFFSDLVPLAFQYDFTFKILLKIYWEFQIEEYGLLDDIIDESISLLCRQRNWIDCQFFNISDKDNFLKMGCEYINCEGVLEKTIINLYDLKNVWCNEHNLLPDVAWTSKMNKRCRELINDCEDLLMRNYIERLHESVFTHNDQRYVLASTLVELKHEIITPSGVNTRKTYSDKAIKQRLYNLGILDSTKSSPLKKSGKVVRVYRVL